MKIDNYQWVGKSKEHIKLTLEYNNKLFPAIGFNFYHYKDIIKEKERVNIAYSIDTNEWNGNTYIDLFIKDISSHLKAI